MLELSHISLFFAALGCWYVALVQDRRRGFALLLATVLFSVYAIASHGIIIDVDPEAGRTVIEQPGLAALGYGLALLSMVLMLFEIFVGLPDARDRARLELSEV